MKYIILLLLLSSCLMATGQDSLQTKSNVVGSVSISSKNFWRGNVYGNNTPSISGTLAYNIQNIFEIGICGTSPTNGSKVGYGIWSEMYISATVENFTMTFDDYFFFNEADSLNDWFNWSDKSTQHIVEYRVKYARERFNITTSVVVYHANSSVNNVYLEGEFFVIPKSLSITAGGVFGESYLNFYDKAGVTHAGVAVYRDIDVTTKFKIPIKLSAMVSPNYKNASQLPGFGQNPFNFIVTANF